MLDKILSFLADYVNSFATKIERNINNTNDTWVPVWNGTELQHRVIPLTYNHIPNISQMQNRNTADVTSTNANTGVNIATLNHKTNTGRYMIFANAVYKTNKNTSNLRVNCAGTQTAFDVTNSTANHQGVLFGVRTCAVGETEQIALVMTPQTGATAVAPAYHQYRIVAIDIPYL